MSYGQDLPRRKGSTGEAVIMRGTEENFSVKFRLFEKKKMFRGSPRTHMERHGLKLCFAL